jgi:DNA invertase Pin-like site-specific DNA recombinase
MDVQRNRAAQYLRMSTDMQRYSIENQAAAIALYAAARGLIVVRSYVDAGRSGLKIDRRDALQNLIDDVVGGRADFRVILVYDVSRWGRFQDTDEAAYYEFICRKAGVSIEYCAEQFENDGSLLAAILKSLKRAMAGEFSRELSVKVHAGQSRLAAQGFRFGAAGYALRRMLVDEHGQHKRLLGLGDRKSLRSEHTILVPGSDDEIAVVHHVYEQFVDKKDSVTHIAKQLNERSIPNSVGRPWTNLSVRALLTNEKYIGTNVYNRTSKKLGGKTVRNDQSDWVRKTDAFASIISPSCFRQAQRRMETIAYRYTDNYMLDCLSATWCKTGRLSRDVIDASEVIPSCNCFKKRFGSLTRAFRLVGFTTDRLANKHALKEVRHRLCELITTKITRRGGTVKALTGYTCQLLINEELNVLIVVGRAAPSSVARGQNSWRFGYRCRKKPDLLIVARLEQGCYLIRDFYVLPFIFFPHGSWLTVSGINYQRLEPFRADSLEPLFDLCARTRLRDHGTWQTVVN